jgi:hypothetical protein
MRTLLLGLLLGIVLTLTFVSLPLFAGPCDSYQNPVLGGADIPSTQNTPTMFNSVGPVWQIRPGTPADYGSVWQDKGQ